MKQTILTIVATTLCIAACTSEDHISQDPLADTPIKLNVSVTNPTTRAGYSNDLLPDTFQLRVYHNRNNDDDKYNYDIFAEKDGDTWKTYDFNAYRPNDKKIKNEVTMFWANMKDPVTVSAYVNNIQSAYFPIDQSDAEKLKKADILYMPNTQVTPNTAINVKFQHIMSKIKLTIELGSEYDFTDKIDQKITDVKIGGTIVEIDEYYAEVNDIDYINIVPDPSGAVKSITPLCTGTTPFSNNAGTITRASASYEAILIPQTIASGKFYVSFKVDGKAYDWCYNEALELKATNDYVLKLTAGSDKVYSAAFSTKPWNVGNGENGENKQTD